MAFFSSWYETKFGFIIHFMDSHNIHIQVAYFLHEMKRILIHYFSWIATKFTFRWLIFFMNFLKFWFIIHFMDNHNSHIQVAYFLHEIKWSFDSLFLMDSRKIYIQIAYFLHELKWNFDSLFLSWIEMICSFNVPFRKQL